MVANKRKILVTGATGQQGGALARLLLLKKHEVYALIRNTEPESPKAQNLRNLGAKLIKGDLDNPESLEQATNGVDSVFLMGTWVEVGTEGETRRGKMMVDIAKEKKIEHLVYSSVVNADKNTGIPHFESKYKVEQHIKNSGIPYTIIGPTFFMDNLLSYSRAGLQQGQLALPLSPSLILQQSALENIAEFFALVLERRNSFLGKRIDIASDELTGEQAAKVLSDELRRKISYVQVPLEQIRQASEDLALMFQWFERIGTGVEVASLHKQYPEVNWLTFKDWVKSQNWEGLAASSTNSKT
ncbi:MAG: NmrA/HSCARG family protein [Thermoproteota archaeon]|nr:NmrA/HSCARG family protein [Thermoproteota archaeon]